MKAVVHYLTFGNTVSRIMKTPLPLVIEGPNFLERVFKILNPASSMRKMLMRHDKNTGPHKEKIIMKSEKRTQSGISKYACLFVVLFLVLFTCSVGYSQSLNNSKFLGYRGIWFTLGQVERMKHFGYSGDYGDKYSGGLSFAWSHTVAPMALYAPEVDKTFFVYGGTTEPDTRYLMAMASYYDHANHRVPRPTIVRDQTGVDDPHDNPSIAIDDDGYIYVFVAGRGRRRPGQIFRATEPYSVDKFEKLISREQTYSHIWHIEGKGFMHLLTLYTAGRELYWETSGDGMDWTDSPAEDLSKLAGFGGHYQVTRLDESRQRVGSAFNYHPERDVDRRTNIYYVETRDFGETWTTVDGKELATPLDDRDNPALVVDYEAKGKTVYITKLVYDYDGNPAILSVVSEGYMPGPKNDPRIWEIVHWTGDEWKTYEVTRSDHNYDMGSLYIDGDQWTVIGPALTGPQPYHTGGEVGLWKSTDGGKTWNLEHEVTRNSSMNHSYVRRPHRPSEPFFGVWADADSTEFSKSRLFFTDSTGDRVYMLPYTMMNDYEEPVQVYPDPDEQ